MEYASNSSGSDMDSDDQMIELRATIVCRWHEDGEGPVRCFLDLRNFLGSATLEIEDPNYNKKTSDYLLQLRKLFKPLPEKPVVEAKPMPPLHEDIVRNIAQYVKSSAGIPGLRFFRLVSKMWNQIGTELLNKEGLTLNLSQRLPPPEPKRNVYGELKVDKLDAYIYNSGHKLKKFIEQPPSGETFAFKTIAISDIEEEGDILMKMFLQPGKPWTTQLTSLSISGFNVLEHNEMMEKIISSFLNLDFLKLIVMNKAENLERYNKDLILQPHKHWWDRKLSRKVIRNKNLKRFCLHFEFCTSKQHEHFNWKFAKVCPNLESLALEYDWDSNTLAEIKSNVLKLRTLELNSCVSSRKSSNLANFVNHYCLANMKVEFYDPAVMIDFFQKVSYSSGTVESLYLELFRPLFRVQHHSLLELLSSTIITPEFTCLKVLHIEVDVNMASTLDLTLAVLRTLIEFKLVASDFLEGYENRWGIRSVVCKISQCFPNLEIFYGDVVNSKETRRLLVELAKLDKLRKLTILEKQDSGVENEGNFNDDFDDYLGLRELSSLTELNLETRKRCITKNLIDFIADDMLGLKRFTLNATMKTEVEKYALERLVINKRIAFRRCFENWY